MMPSKYERRPVGGAAAPGTRVLGSAFRLPVLFEENVGQAPEGVRWLLRRPAGTVWFYDHQVAFELPVRAGRAPRSSRTARKRPSPPPREIRMEFAGGCVARVPHAETRLEASGNVVSGGRATRHGLASRIVYRSIVPGVDLHFYDDRGQLRYDVVVAEGGDVSRFRLRWRGARLRLDGRGNLAVLTPHGRMLHSAPRCFEGSGTTRRRVAGRFALHPDHEVGFDVQPATAGSELTIDPVIAFGGFVGEERDLLRWSLDASGSLCDVAWVSWAGAFVYRLDCSLPDTPRVVFFVSLPDLYVTQIASAGEALYLLVQNPSLVGDDRFREGIASFGVPADALDAAPSQSSLIVRLEGDGSLGPSTRLLVTAARIAVDRADPTSGLYLAGRPVGEGASRYGDPLRALVAMGPNYPDFLVAKLDPELRQVRYLTSVPLVAGIAAIDGDLLVCGHDHWTAFATTAGAFSEGDPPPVEGDAGRLFVTRLGPAGEVSFTGHLGDGEVMCEGELITAHPDGSCSFLANFLTDLPEESGIPQQTREHILFHLSADGATLGETRNYGIVTLPQANDWEDRLAVYDIASDGGSVWVCGATSTAGRGTLGAVQRRLGGSVDGFVSVVDADGAEGYFTYLGGAGFDYLNDVASADGLVYALGRMRTSDVPVTIDPSELGAPTESDLYLLILGERDPSTSVSLEKSCSTGSVTVGQPFTYSLTLVNDGTAAVDRLVLEDVAPEGVILLPNPPWVGDTGRAFVEEISLDPGESKTYTLGAIAEAEGCFVNEGRVILGGAIIATATCDAPCAVYAGPPQLAVRIFDNSAALAGEPGPSKVLVGVVVQNIGARPAVGVTLRHRSDSLAFSQVVPIGGAVTSTTPPTSWDAGSGRLEEDVGEYIARFAAIAPGASVYLGTITEALKNGEYQTTATAAVDGHPDVATSTDQSFGLGAKADVRLRLGLSHESDPGGYQRFEIEVARASDDPGERPPPLELTLAIDFPEGAPPPTLEPGMTALEINGEPTVLGLVRAVGGHWRADFVLPGVPIRAVVEIPADVVVASATASVGGRISSLPDPVTWP